MRKPTDPRKHMKQPERLLIEKRFIDLLQYEKELEAFEESVRRKAAGEKEALEDEVARLELRLAAKKAELEKRASK